MFFPLNCFEYSLKFAMWEEICLRILFAYAERFETITTYNVLNVKSMVYCSIFCVRSSFCNLSRNLFNWLLPFDPLLQYQQYRLTFLVELIFMKRDGGFIILMTAFKIERQYSAVICLLNRSGACILINFLVDVSYCSFKKTWITSALYSIEIDYWHEVDGLIHTSDMFS